MSARRICHRDRSATLPVLPAHGHGKPRPSGLPSRPTTCALTRHTVIRPDRTDASAPPRIRAARERKGPTIPPRNENSPLAQNASGQERQTVEARVLSSGDNGSGCANLSRPATKSAAAPLSRRRRRSPDAIPRAGITMTRAAAMRESTPALFSSIHSTGPA